VSVLEITEEEKVGAILRMAKGLTHGSLQAVEQGIKEMLEASSVTTFLDTFTDDQLASILGHLSERRPNLNLQGAFITDAYNRHQPVFTNKFSGSTTIADLPHSNS
jgi:hypothetical protein